MIRSRAAARPEWWLADALGEATCSCFFGGLLRGGGSFCSEVTTLSIWKGTMIQWPLPKLALRGTKKADLMVQLSIIAPPVSFPPTKRRHHGRDAWKAWRARAEDEEALSLLESTRRGTAALARLAGEAETQLLESEAGRQRAKDEVKKGSCSGRANQRPS